MTRARALRPAALLTGFALAGLLRERSATRSARREAWSLRQERRDLLASLAMTRARLLNASTQQQPSQQPSQLAAEPSAPVSPPTHVAVPEQEAVLGLVSGLDALLDVIATMRPGPETVAALERADAATPSWLRITGVDRDAPTDTLQQPTGPLSRLGS